MGTQTTVGGVCMQTIRLLHVFFMQTIRLTVCIYANYYTRTGSMNADLRCGVLYVCKASDYGRLYLCRLWQVCVFSPLQGMDGSGEPLLQFKFRVQFYVETHLLLRYVYSRLCWFHHFLSSAAMPRLPLITLATASPTTCTLLIVLSCCLHHFSHLFVLTPTALIVLVSRSCARHHSRSPQVSSPLNRVPTTCCFVLMAFLSLRFDVPFSGAFVLSVPSVLIILSPLSQGWPLPPPLLPPAARERVAVPAAPHRGGRLFIGLARAPGRPRGLQRGPAPRPLLRPRPLPPLLGK